MKEWFDTLQDETDYQPKKVSKIQRELAEARLSINKEEEDSKTTFSGLKIRKNQNNYSFHTAEKIPKPSKNSSFESEPRWLSSQKYRVLFLFFIIKTNSILASRKTEFTKI